MPKMKSKDVIVMELKGKLMAAMQSEDETAIAQVFAEFAETMQADILEDARAYQATADSTILAKRGIHQLTAEENKFYMGLIGAMGDSNPKMAIGNIDVALPETVVDNVMADIRRTHPLLAAIKFENTTVLTKMIVNKQGPQMALWGQLNGAVTQELTGAIGVEQMALIKLSAFMPISKDMLAVGPQWIDAYVRATLSEAVALATEFVIVTGTGKDQPIGMDRDVSEGVVITGGVYPKKAAVAITDLSPATYGQLLSTLSQGPNEKARPISKVILVVNPADYFTKVFPATTVRTADGSYNKDVFPFPTEVIQSPAVTAGEAIIGLPERYKMGIGAGTDGGKIEYSDDFKFLDDQRVYLIKMYGNGKPMDDKAFIRLNIANLKPTVAQVYVTNADEFPVA